MMQSFTLCASMLELELQLHDTAISCIIICVFIFPFAIRLTLVLILALCTSFISCQRLGFVKASTCPLDVLCRAQHYGPSSQKDSSIIHPKNFSIESAILAQTLRVRPFFGASVLDEALRHSCNADVELIRAEKQRCRLHIKHPRFTGSSLEFLYMFVHSAAAGIFC